MTGTAATWHDASETGTVEDETSKRYFTFRRFIAEDEIGRAFLIRGEAVSFEVGTDKRGRPRAIKVKPLSREKINPAEWAGEYCTVNDDPRFAQRPVGGQLFLSGEHFRSGNVILVTKFQKPRHPGERWRAIDPQFVAHTTEEFEASQCSSV